MRSFFNPFFAPRQKIKHVHYDWGRYKKLETCLNPLPHVSNIKEIAGGQLAKWPERLNAIPPRISSGSLPGITEMVFVENSELWKKRVEYYKTIDYQLAETGRYRNLLDMNAYLGGFAAALVDDPVWVMNIVPVEADQINTLGVVYERGLIGTYQNWYLPFALFLFILFVSISHVLVCFFIGVKQCLLILGLMISFMAIPFSASTKTGKNKNPNVRLFCFCWISDGTKWFVMQM